ncbi:MAG TPA: hypothetical protein VH743_11825 [Beijerinckiaceae bacterium]
MIRLSLALSAVCLTMPWLAGPAAAQDQKTTRSGQPVVVRVFYNCARPGNHPNAAGSASNGTVTLHEATRNRCGNPRQPVVEAVYTPKPGFKGTDEVIFVAGTRARVRVTVR